jgi:hypothetical protein
VTYKEFYKELRKLKGQYKFQGDMIRACSPNVGYCPIAGVSQRKGGPQNAQDGAQFLRMRENMLYNIMDAADNNIENARIKSIRVGLLKSLGLKEVA